MKPTLCERVAAPLLVLHRKTTPVAAVVMLGGVGLIGVGLAKGNAHVAWVEC